MGHFDIYRDQLAITYPSFGHALWNPAPEGEYGPVRVGDVGYIREGRFFRLFNALLSADDPSHKDTPLPEYHEPLIPNVPNHIFKGTLKPNHYCSAGVNVEPKSECLAMGPDDAVQTSFSCRRWRGGAVLTLPVEAQSQDTRARGDFGNWMLKHIDRWFAFARGLGLGIDQMGEIILVTGCDCTRSWANVAFLEGQMHGQASFGVQMVQGHDVSINWQFSPGNAQGAVCNWGPEGKNLPEDQCVFIRGLRVVRVFGILPKHLKGAAEPNPSLEEDHDDDESDKALISLPAPTDDPLHVLSDYIAERAPDCDMVLIHDDDLARIAGFSERKEIFQPDALIARLKTAQPEVQQILCDSSQSDTGAINAAMFAEEFREWGLIPPQQSIIDIRQGYAQKPDDLTSQAFVTASPSKHIPSDDRISIAKHHPLKETMGNPDPQSGSTVEPPQQPSETPVPQCSSKAELPSRESAGTPFQKPSNILSSSLMSLMHILCCITTMLGTVVRRLKSPQITLAIVICAYLLIPLSDAVGSVLAPCAISVDSLLCTITGFGVPSHILNADRTPLWSDFPSLLNMERRYLESLLDQSVQGSGLALEMRKVEMATSDLVTLVRVSNLNSREILADSLSEFVKDARRVGHGLTRFSSKVGRAVDNVIIINDYALHRIEAADSRLSGLSIRRFWRSYPPKAASKDLVTQIFTDAMDTLSANMQHLALEAEVLISDLSRLEEHLASIHEVISREDSSIITVKSESLARLWTALGGNRNQPNGLDGYLALRDMSGYQDRALAHVVEASKTLEIMAEDIEGLRERVAAPDLVGYAIPFHAHIQSLKSGLDRLKGPRIRAMQLELEEQTMNRISESVDVERAQ